MKNRPSGWRGVLNSICGRSAESERQSETSTFDVRCLNDVTAFSPRVRPGNLVMQQQVGIAVTGTCESICHLLKAAAAQQGRSSAGFLGNQRVTLTVARIAVA